jgi:hypothetical protein
MNGLATQPLGKEGRRRKGRRRAPPLRLRGSRGELREKDE